MQWLLHFYILEALGQFCSRGCSLSLQLQPLWTASLEHDPWGRTSQFLQFWNHGACKLVSLYLIFCIDRYWPIYVSHVCIYTWQSQLLEVSFLLLLCVSWSLNPNTSSASHVGASNQAHSCMYLHLLILGGGDATSVCGGQRVTFGSQFSFHRM